MHYASASDNIILTRQSNPIQTMLATKTNVIMLDTVTLLSLLVITVSIVQVFSLTVETNTIQSLTGKRFDKRSLGQPSSETKFLIRPKRKWDQEYTRRNKFRKRNSMTFGFDKSYDAHSSQLYTYPR